MSLITCQKDEKIVLTYESFTNKLKITLKDRVGNTNFFHKLDCPSSCMNFHHNNWRRQRNFFKHVHTWLPWPPHIVSNHQPNSSFIWIIKNSIIIVYFILGQSRRFRLGNCRTKFQAWSSWPFTKICQKSSSLFKNVWGSFYVDSV